MRPDSERGERSQPCCMNAPNTNQNEFDMLNSLTAGWESWAAVVGPPTSSAANAEQPKILFKEMEKK